MSYFCVLLHICSVVPLPGEVKKRIMFQPSPHGTQQNVFVSKGLLKGKLEITFEVKATNAVQSLDAAVEHIKPLCCHSVHTSRLNYFFVCQCLKDFANFGFNSLGFSDLTGFLV